jgi:filamentous hemagglutinin family protein
MKAFKRISRRYYFKHILIYTLIELMLFFAPLPALLANPNPASGTLPTGHSAPYGGVGAFNYDNTAHTLDITNVANRTVINWQNFDIGQGATVNFQQASSSAYVLNRVNATDGMASGIKGTLNANGGVIIVNPRGIVFGPSALINAGKFIASGLGISDSDFRDFAQGNTSVLKFNADCLSGNVTNEGTINATDSIYLVGKNVTNTGTISCPGGMVVMTAGDKIYLAESGSNVTVEKLDTEYIGDNVVTSGGTINAADSGVLLAAGDIYSQAAITGARSFVAMANVNLTVSGAVDVTGDITLLADTDHMLPGDAGIDLTIKGRDCFPSEWPWGNIHATQPLNAGRDITIYVTGEKEEARWISDGLGNPGSWEFYTIYEPGTIRLDGDVIAGRNLSIYNNTYTGSGVTLKATTGNILFANNQLETAPPGFAEWLIGDTWLALRAGTDIIAPQTTISVTGSKLIMEQGLSIDLADYLFDLQASTDLTLISNNGSVTATTGDNAADQWHSIGAAAQTDISLSGAGSIRSGDSGTDPTKSLWAKTGNVDIQAGQDFIADKDIEAGQNVTISSSAVNTTYLGGNVYAGQNVLLNDNTNLNGSGDQTINAQNGTVVANGTLDKTTGGQMNVTAADGITLNGSASAVDSMYLNADTENDGTGDMLAQSTLTTTNGNIDISASDATIKLQDNVSAGQHLSLNSNTEVAANKVLHANQDMTLAGGKTITGLGNLKVDAGRNVWFGGDVSAAGNLVVMAGPHNTGSSIFSWGKLSSGWDMLVEAGQDIFLGDTPDSAISGGHMTLSAGEATGHETGNLITAGNLQAAGNITLNSSDNTTYLGGNVTAGHDLILNNNTKAIGFSDQTLLAGNQLTALGFLRKTTSGNMYLMGNSEDGAEKSIDLQYIGEGPGTSTSHGNLWILGENDIQISDDVTTFGPSCFGIIQSEIPDQRASGGVAIISETGSIYTDGADGALNVSVTGSSDNMATDYRERGVYGFAPPINSGTIESAAINKFETPEGVAAIAIVSDKELKIGGDARLEARGTYYDGAEVDDRGAIGFLDFDAEIPDGTSRNQGDPFDLAIYTASRNSSVTIDCPVTITSAGAEPPVPTIKSIAPTQLIARGAMAIDALDIVTLGADFRQSLANGEIGDRLEVCSRITEWLDDAAGRLPFPKDLVLPDGYNYVMRGAGAENPDIGKDAPAWVLEYRPRQTAAPIQQNQLKFTGCPAVMNWVANELGIEKDQIQIYVDGAMAMSSDVQPCEVCAQLKNTALVLLDPDGSQLKALAGVVNEFAGGAPPSEEQMAMIATAMNEPQEGSQYALAAQWLDALTSYVNILNKDLQLPMDETLAFAQKYTSPAVNSGNAALATYVQAKLASLGG